MSCTSRPPSLWCVLHPPVHTIWSPVYGLLCRLYLINSPVVRGETLRFQKEGVRDVLKDVFLPWFNAFRFLIQNIQQRKTEKGIDFSCDASQPLNPTNTMDKWILSFTQSLVKFVHKEMAGVYSIMIFIGTLVPRPLPSPSVPPLHSCSSTGQVHQPIDQLVRSVQPQEGQGEGVSVHLCVVSCYVCVSCC